MDAENQPEAKPSRPSFWRLLDQIFASSLPASACWVLVVLLRHTNQRNHEGACWPSVARIAQLSKLNRTTVIGHLKTLESLGVISVKRVNGRWNRYSLDLEKLTNYDPDPSRDATGRNLRPVGLCDGTRRVTRPDQSDYATGPVVSRDPNDKRTTKGTTKRTISGDSSESSSRSKATADEVAMTFPIDGGKEWHLTKSKLAEYRETFPGVDIESEFRKALQWTRDNPTRRKKAIGMPRFLGSWLERSAKKPAHAKPHYSAVDSEPLEIRLLREDMAGREDR